jgi:hypothetical protein
MIAILSILIYPRVDDVLLLLIAPRPSQTPYFHQKQKINHAHQRNASCEFYLQVTVNAPSKAPAAADIVDGRPALDARCFLRYFLSPRLFLSSSLTSSRQSRAIFALEWKCQWHITPVCGCLCNHQNGGDCPLKVSSLVRLEGAIGTIATSSHQFRRLTPMKPLD